MNPTTIFFKSLLPFYLYLTVVASAGDGSHADFENDIHNSTNRRLTVSNGTDCTVFTNVQIIRVRHGSKLVNLDIIQHEKAQVIFTENPSNESVIIFNLTTTGFSEDSVKNVLISHTISAESIKIEIIQQTTSIFISPAALIALGASGGILMLAITIIVCCHLCKKRQTLNIAKRHKKAAEHRPDFKTPVSRLSGNILQGATYQDDALDQEFEQTLFSPKGPQTYRNLPDVRVNQAYRHLPEPLFNQLDRISEGQESEEEEKKSVEARSISSTSLVPAKSFFETLMDQLPYIDCSDVDDDDVLDSPVQWNITHNDVIHNEFPVPQRLSRGSMVEENPDPYIRERPQYGQGHRIRGPYAHLVTFSIILALGLVYAICHNQPTSVLTVSIPKSMVLRKVRSFRDDPALSDLAVSAAGLPLVTRLQLLDFNGCRGNLTACQIYAVCDTASDSMTCRCSRGSYVSGNKCRACRTSCPEGAYMKQPCTGTSDVVCQPCSICQGTTYEAASCTTTKDRLCIDVTFPVNHFTKSTSGVTINNDDGTLVNVTTSPNVFIEKLTNIRSLESSMYVTNNQNTMEYIWHRSSGLQIKISVTGVYLVPEYVDVDVDQRDDNLYFRNNKNMPREIIGLFEETTTKYCRHPVPDYYQLYLEIFPNRTTAAEAIVCDSQNASVPVCPLTHTDGSRYILRSINENCPKIKAPKLQTLPIGHKNSVVCPDKNVLLRQIFLLTDTHLRELTFPSSECELHRKECNRCLQQQTCTNISRIPLQSAKCCQIPCYNRGACVQALSPICPAQGVECATGDISLFTLQPVFNNFHLKFWCHMKYRQPVEMYNVEYTIILPKIKMTLKSRNKTVYADTRDYHRKGTAHMDYMYTNHNVNMDINEEFLLSGNHDQVKDGLFKLYHFKSGHEFKTKYTSRQLRDNVFTSRLQFERPFVYSSYNWGYDECEKNMSRIFPAQTMYKIDDIPVSASVLSENDSFHYQMLPNGPGPIIKLRVKENQSILRWHRGDFLAAVIDGDSLEAGLNWFPNNSTWNIWIKGVLSGCPAYISLEVYDKSIQNRLTEYDIIVNCPERFSVAVDLQRNRRSLPDIFLIIVNDSSTSHRLYFTSLNHPKYLPKHQADAANAQGQTDTSWTKVLFIAIFTGVALVICFLVMIVILLRKKEIGDIFPASKNEKALLNNRENERLQDEMSGVRIEKRKPLSKCVSIICIILYILYSLIFTFTCLLAILYVFTASSVQVLSKINTSKEVIQNNVSFFTQEIKSYEEGEVIKMLKLFQERQLACTHHVNEDLQIIARDVTNITRGQIQNVYNASGSLHNTLQKFVQLKLDTYKGHLHDCVRKYNETLNSHFKSFSEKYENYIQRIADNDWLTFPRDVFKIQQSDPEPLDIGDYFNWLGVGKVNEIRDVKESIVNRLVGTLPEFPLDNLNLSLQFSTPRSNPESDLVVGDGLDLMIPNHMYKFITGSDYKAAPVEVLPYDIQPTTESSVDQTKQPNNTPDIANSAEGRQDFSIGKYYPIIIAILILVDVCLLTYRLTWLKATVKKAKHGIEEKFPLDDIACTIYSIKTGTDAPRAYDPLEHPYTYYVDHKEEKWDDMPEHNPIFLQESPKSKEDILREIWNHNKKQKPKKHAENHGRRKFVVRRICVANFSFLAHFIKTFILWKFILLFVIFILLCLVVKTTNDFVTMETFTFFMNSHVLLPHLQEQVNLTNSVLVNYANYLNDYLLQYKETVSMEVNTVNSGVSRMLQEQESLWELLTSELCTLGQNTSVSDLCRMPLLALSPRASLSSCNFLPVQPQLYEGFRPESFQNYINQELSPIVEVTRLLVINIVHVILIFLCTMYVLHCVSSVFKVYLIKNKCIPAVKIFQTSTSSQYFEDHQESLPRDMKKSASWLQSSESGVYVGDSEECMRESNM